MDEISLHVVNLNNFNIHEQIYREQYIKETLNYTSHY